MTRENLAGKKTSVWNYDELGNITSKSEYAYTTVEDLKNETVNKTVKYYYPNDKITYQDSTKTTKTYSSWNNILVAVDLDGSNDVANNEIIEYDQIGNPTSYLGATLKWNGRQLTSYKTSDKEITYTYDSNGIRSSKIQEDYTVAEDGTKTLTKTTETKYYYVNGQLHFQDTLATDSAGKQTVTKLHFYYDSNGYLTGIKYNGTNYYVATNRRGDVVALYYYDGRIMGRYEYDAWGNVIKIEDISYDSAGNQVIKDITNDTSSRDALMVNPIRYRSYYYDLETNLYYLQSRYYNPEVGRFLNADSQLNQQSGPLGFNMFAYAENNPIMFSDPTGHSIILACLIGGAIIGAITGGAIGASVSKIQTGKVSAKAVVGGALAGAVIGGAVGAAMGAIGQKIATKLASKGVSDVVKKTGSEVSEKFISKGSSGRTTPVNLKEKLAMEQVRSNPMSGATKINIKLKDVRWPSSEGWTKMANNVNGVEIHFNYNEALNLFDDFKYVN